MRQRSQSNCLRLPAHFSSAARVKKSMSEPVDAVRNDPTWKSHPFSRLSVTSVLLPVLCAQSSPLREEVDFPTTSRGVRNALIASRRKYEIRSIPCAE
jgi:hypothetical protein